jgi:hypothetical protein
LNKRAGQNATSEERLGDYCVCVNINISRQEPYEDVEEYDGVHKELQKLAKTQNEQCLGSARNTNCDV